MAWGKNVNIDGSAAQYWGTQNLLADTVVTSQATATLRAWDVACLYGRSTPTGTREDTAQFGMRICKRAGAGLWGIGLASELPGIETRLDALITSLASHISTAYTMTQYVWHERAIDHPTNEDGSEKIGAAIRYTSKSIAGAQLTDRNADQVSATVTFKTASRKHWGRVYLPGIATGQMNKTYGRWTPAFADAVAGYFRTFINGLATDGYDLVVYSYKKKAIMQVVELQVDDIVDIQRRRRAKQRSYAKTYSS